MERRGSEGEGERGGVWLYNEDPSMRQLARTVRPDAILLDILMPDFDGWAVLDALQRDPGHGLIPVVILSIIDEKKRALDAGAAGIVAKPVERAELLKAVNDACDTRRRPGAIARCPRHRPTMRAENQSKGAQCRSF